MTDDRIDGVRIASPCSVSWEAMDGDERARHCAVCSLNVYNFAGMTRDEVRALLASSEGRVCARLYRRADGTVLTRDCPTGLRALRRRASRAAAAAVAALLSLPAFAFGDAGVTIHSAKVKLTTDHTAMAQAAAFTGVVGMEDGPLPGVTITLRDEATGREVTTVTDVNGVFTFGVLTAGTYRADVALAGFEPGKIEHLKLQSGSITRANIALQAARVEMGIIVAAAEPVKHDPLSTTFTQSFIDKLP